MNIRWDIPLIMKALNLSSVHDFENTQIFKHLMINEGKKMTNRRFSIRHLKMGKKVKMPPPDMPCLFYCGFPDTSLYMVNPSTLIHWTQGEEMEMDPIEILRNLNHFED